MRGAGYVCKPWSVPSYFVPSYFALPDGAQPIAQAYSGHQFGHFSPQLGDGRALLIGEVMDRQGRRRDIAFKAVIGGGNWR